jgi:hypothetical protein
MQTTPRDAQSLEQLEGMRWGEPTAANSNMVNRCLSLRKVPLRELTSGDLRLLIGQQISLAHVLPLALRLLETCPLLEGEYYEGDLLQSVLTIDWGGPEARKFRPQVLAIAKRAHLQMMSEATSALLQGHSPQDLGLSAQAVKDIERRAIQELNSAPWEAVVNFLETFASH